MAIIMNTVAVMATERRKLVENIKFTVRMMAAYMRMSIEQMAKEAGIEENHLLNVSAGRTKMTGDDVVKLSKFTGIPVQNIEV